MPSPPALCHDPERLRVLRDFQILDTEDEEDWDAICRLATEICGTSIGMVNFIDRDRQWFKSKVGVELKETPLEHSFCQHAIQEQECMVVPDLLQDRRFQQNPFCLSDPHVRFYAGAVIRSEGGHVLGTVCVLDQQPQALRPGQVEALQTLARQARTMLELRQRNRELQAAESRARAALAQAEQADAAKTDFLAKLSHELRTPLTPVLMTASALLEDPGMPAAMHDDLRVLLRNVETEASLIDDLLDVTRIVHGKMELRLAPCDLHEVVERALEVCRPQWQERQLQVEVDLRAEHHGAAADATRLQQVIWNLLTNAAKFTPPGGRLRLRSRNHLEGGGPPRWRLEVSDTGRGMEPAQLQTLFQVFEQGGREVTRSYGGLGLGLAICKGIVELHGGEISAHSAGPGHGCTFRVELTTDRSLPARVPIILPQAPGEETSPVLRILLVEDHQATARILGRLLGTAGHRVAHAATLAEARAEARAHEFDIVVSDLGLPDGTGEELMTELRGTYGLPGIALSGYGMEEDVARSRAAGFARHLVKPVNFADLREALRAVATRTMEAAAAA